MALGSIDLESYAKLPPRGHAIELRVYAEDPALQFLPSIGKLEEVLFSTAPGIRVDSGVEKGGEVTIDYDPMLAKLIAHGATRAEAIDRLRAAIVESFIAGVETTLSFGHELLGREDFRSGDLSTTFIADRMPNWSPKAVDPDWQDAIVTAAQHLASQRRTSDRAGHSPNLAPSEILRGWRHRP